MLPAYNTFAVTGLTQKIGLANIDLYYFNLLVGTVYFYGTDQQHFFP